MLVLITSHKQRNTWAKKIFLFPHGVWKDNIRCEILDRRPRSARNINWSLKRRVRPAGHSNRLVSSPCVFSGRWTTSQKGSPPQKKDTCELSLTAFYNTQSTSSKNKNINDIFIYLRVLFVVCQAVQYATPRLIVTRLYSWRLFWMVCWQQRCEINCLPPNMPVWRNLVSGNIWFRLEHLEVWHHES